ERGKVLATKGNLNNEIGLPLTLLGLKTNHDYAVIEMGMNHPGEIAYLCTIAKPDIALVTNAASAHLEGLGSVEAVARAKGEIFGGLGKKGIAIVNADDAFAPLWRDLAKESRIVEFGLEKKSAFTADYSLGELASEISMHTPEGPIELKINVPGLHNVKNALAAAAAAMSAGIDVDAVKKGLEKFTGVAGRMQRKKGKKDSVLIDDTYNANPDSVRAAIAWLSRVGGKTLIILGDMGELGADSPRLHEEIGAFAKESKIGMLLTLGKASEAISKAFGKDAEHFGDVDLLAAKAMNLLSPGMTVLVKGSRFMKMERVVEKLEEKSCS
ncbi:MAG TPA: UDP-N-acetylmuramoyl-tripeptide--D-alanyl-D-alanine ligase, partial [Burkholderiales bacterium]|nr:UDP-N-acetylmuramoyl-tripeptide--D-alanyl-D-alanine ligase [Burkholderiales bacterium]